MPYPTQLILYHSLLFWSVFCCYDKNMLRVPVFAKFLIQYQYDENKRACMVRNKESCYFILTNTVQNETKWFYFHRNSTGNF